MRRPVRSVQIAGAAAVSLAMAAGYLLYAPSQPAHGAVGTHTASTVAPLAIHPGGMAVDASAFDAPSREVLGADVKSIRRIATIDGRGFFVSSSGGHQCLVVGGMKGTPLASGGDAAVVDAQGCSAGATVDGPVADMSVVQIQPATGVARVTRLEGFASDGVAKLVYRDANGASTSTAPVGNAYSLGVGVPAGRPYSLTALAADGSTLKTYYFDGSP